MTLASDLFMVEDDLIKENELIRIIKGDTTKRKNLMSNLSVITDNNHLKDFSENEILNNNEKFENKISEIKVKKCKGSYDKNEISEIKIFKIQDSNDDVYSYKMKNIEREMIKSYLKILSH